MKIFVKLFTAVNLGDDLFLKILLERYPHTNFVLPASNIYKEIFKEYDNLKIIEDNLYKRKNLFQKIIGVIERNLFPGIYRKKLQLTSQQALLTEDIGDAFISIGGSIFMQPKKLPAYLDVEYYKLANNYFTKTFFIGCNFGPYNDQSYKEGYQEIFRQAADVCFREKLSYDIFSDLNNVRYSPDIVFGLNYKDQKKRDKSVGFSIVTARNKTNKERYISKYAELVELYQNRGYEIYLFSFCKKQGDEDVINDITDLLRSKTNINKVFYNGNIDTFLDLYSSVEKMFCGRFHSMILSMLFNQKIYPVIYSKKMTNVLDDINYQGKVIFMEDFHKIKPDEIFTEIDLNHYEIESQKDKSNEQFKKIDLFLNK